MWRQNPTTKLVLKFLRDYRVQLVDDISQSLFKGETVDKLHIDKVAIACGVFEDVETLDADAINSFYGIETSQTEENKETKNV